MKTVIKINDMMCEHCKKAVSEGLSAINGVTALEIDLSAKTATVEHDCDLKILTDCIEELGFDPEI